VGPCLTDAAPKDRSQRTARASTAMMPPGRMRRQSLRLSWPGGSIRTSMTATVTTQILAQLPRLSIEQTVAGSIRVITNNFKPRSPGRTSFDLQLERCDQFCPAQTLLLGKGGELIETHALNFDAHLFHPRDKGVAPQ
jgi:hypothetical protein